MSKREYIQALNDEIEKLNEVIDFKILHESDYRRESVRHRKLLSRIRREEARRSIVRLTRAMVPSWF